jgi:hypothetical protein
MAVVKLDVQSGKIKAKISNYRQGIFMGTFPNASNSGDMSWKPYAR